MASRLCAPTGSSKSNPRSSFNRGPLRSRTASTNCTNTCSAAHSAARSQLLARARRQQERDDVGVAVAAGHIQWRPPFVDDAAAVVLIHQHAGVDVCATL